ncbi:MAG: response regulator transcription factor [Anaerolineae bacterium]|nr:response regulator transcription factor [Anaerolineae bacterium]
MVIRILLADDQPAVRDGLRMRLELEPDLTIVGEACDGLEAVTLAQALVPNVVVMDVEMPGLDGIEAARRLRAKTPSMAVVILSIHSDATTRGRACEAGAVAFVEKRAAIDVLLAEIRRAAQSYEEYP